MIFSKPRRAIIVAKRPKEVEALLLETIARQECGDKVNWSVAESDSFKLLFDGMNFHIARNYISKDFTLKSRTLWQKRRRISVEIDSNLPSGKLHSMLIYVDAANQDECIEFLDAIITAMNLPNTLRADKAYIVIDEGLSLLEPLTPAIDSVDEWERALGKNTVLVPPVELAKQINEWRTPLMEFLNGRLTKLEKALLRSAKTVKVFPISGTGFHAFTGEILSPNTTGIPAVPFNLDILVQVLSGAISEELPSLLTWRTK